MMKNFFKIKHAYKQEDSTEQYSIIIKSGLNKIKNSLKVLREIRDMQTLNLNNTMQV